MTEIIGDKGISRFDPDLAKEINKKVEDEKRREKLEEKVKPKQETIIQQKTNSEIQNFSDYWTVSNVKYQDKIVKIDLAKELLDKPAKNGYEIADAQLHYSIFKALYNNSDNPETKEIKEFLQKSFGKEITTSTDIEYNPIGDLVRHNSIQSNLSNKYIISTEITGPNEYIIDSTSPKRYKAILGSYNLQEINDVFKGLFEGNSFGWFLNDKKGMRKKEIRNVKFLGGGAINLLCMGKINFEFRALGMRYSNEKTL